MEIETYVVQPFHGNNYYTDSQEHAEEVYSMLCQQGKSVQLLKGEPGHYKTIKQN